MNVLFCQEKSVCRFPQADVVYVDSSPLYPVRAPSLPNPTLAHTDTGNKFPPPTLRSLRDLSKVQNISRVPSAGPENLFFLSWGHGLSDLLPDWAVRTGNRQQKINGRNLSVFLGFNFPLAFKYLLSKKIFSFQHFVKHGEKNLETPNE